LTLELSIDVTQAAGLGAAAHTRVSVVLPDPATMDERPIVAFALPGAGYGRRYFTLDMPGAEAGGQAGWHARRGWIFVAIDSLGVGEATGADPAALSMRTIATANHATVQEILHRLARGRIAVGFPPVAEPVTLGLGQSMGGGLTIVQQAHHDTYDGIGVLGFSAVYTTARGFPAGPPSGVPYLTRDMRLDDPLSAQARAAAGANPTLARLQRNRELYFERRAAPASWNYHFDDVAPEIVERDLSFAGEPPPWRSPTIPAAVFWMLAPGALGPEAAAIVVPVLSAFGERDVAEDPRMEPKAFRHAVDFSSFICPRMGHMHNFASTRELLWSRIHHWGAHVAELKRRLPHDWPAGLFSDSC
jgi:hypothetical protein